MVLAQQAQIIIGTMHNQLVPLQFRPERVQIEVRQRIDQLVTGGGADLQEAKFFRVSM